MLDGSGDSRRLQAAKNFFFGRYTNRLYAIALRRQQNGSRMILQSIFVLFSREMVEGIAYFRGITLQTAVARLSRPVCYALTHLR